MTPPKQADELLKALDQHIGQMSPHIRERRTAQLLIDARDALRARHSSPEQLPKDLPSRFHAVWNDGFRAYTKEQLAWVFFQKGAESMLAQPPSTPPEAGKEEVVPFVEWDKKFAEPPSAQGEVDDFIKELKGLPELIVQNVCEIPYRFGPEDHPNACVVSPEELRGIVERNIETLLERHPSPVAQGAGVEWISVKERLPELVHVENKETIFLGRILTIERMSDRVIVSLDDQDFSADMLVHIGGHEFPIWRRHGDRVKFWKPGPPTPQRRMEGEL
jgi:hypothetical protein